MAAESARQVLRDHLLSADEKHVFYARPRYLARQSNLEPRPTLEGLGQELLIHYRLDSQ